MIALLTAALLAQAPVLSQFDDGVIIGRVCEDLDADGVCSTEEPGVAGARVLLETGLEAASDREGRFHFAAVGARAADAFAGGRLQPGRHRVKLVPASLSGRWTGAEVGRTVEVPVGAAVSVSFALRRLESAPPSAGEASPAFRGSRGALEFEVVLTPREGETLFIDGVEASRAWKTLRPGENVVLVASAAGGQVQLWTLRFALVERRESTLVLPLGTAAIGELAWSATGVLSTKLAPSWTLEVSGKALSLDPGGRGTRPLEGRDATVTLRGVGGEWQLPLRRHGAEGLVLNGLLDLEAGYDFRRGAFSLFGRGAAAARASFFGFELGAELDLRDTDLAALQPSVLLQARRVDVFSRQLDPMRSQLAWADDAATIASNAGEGRLRLELSREGLGRLGYGSTRWFTASADAGRSHRALQGAFLEVQTPAQHFAGASLKAVAAPAQLDALSGLGRRQMHERFESTGGSLFFLANGGVVAGSERVRIEWRDAVTQLPLRDTHLQRLRDYTLDALSGRILLARPLSFFVGESLLQSDPLTAGVVGVLVVDYEYVDASPPGSAFLGAEARGRVGPATLTLGAQRDGAWSLLRGAAEARLGPVWLSAEAARSTGGVQGLAFSRDGGLTRSVLAASSDEVSGWAVTLRARSKGLFGRGSWDAAWRWRQQGFEDVAQVGALNQVSLRGEQPLGPVIVTALVDLRDMPDPRDPFSGARVQGRTLGGGVGYEQAGWGVRLEAREFEQSLASGTRGGLTVGLAGRYRITPWLQLRAGYRQQVLSLGGMELTFASVGVDVKPSERLELGLRGGWGPALGPQVWGNLAWSRGDETWYGVHSLDADAPGAGDRRLVTGVRQQLDANAAVFVEDVSATDVDGLRLSRAVGLTQRLGDAFTLSARYEHGARSLEGLGPDVARNAGGLSLAWERDALRLFARGEVRDELGAWSLRQLVASGGGEWRVHRDVSLTARALWTHSVRNDTLVGRNVDATLAAAWRFERGELLARYAWKQSWAPTLEQRLHVVSLLPTLRFGDRFALGAGAHLGFTELGPILSGSIRPSVRLWEGLEVAAEAAARTFAPDGGSWASLRGEVGYRFDHRFFIGAGYTAFGFSGTGLDNGAAGSRDRVYLRTEVSY